MNTNEIMEDIHHNHDKLPILTEVVRPAALALGNSGKGIVNLQLAIIEPDPDPGGYDPYNSAPPVPVDKEEIQRGRSD